MKGMLTMTDINTIKNLRNNHDKSIDHIRKELGINWRTAKSMQTKISFLYQRQLKKRVCSMTKMKNGEKH